MSELKAEIQTALNNFARGNLLENAKNLLNVLGYESDRTFQLQPNSFAGLSKYFETDAFDKKKAKVEDWKSIDIIFQVTADDVKKSRSLFDTKKVDNTIIESYLFFAISLSGDKYTRGDLVKITREINKLTPMPSMILFRYNDYLTIAVIDRRLHKRESLKDVLEKVTLIKDINIPNPHRAHIEILNDLSFEELQQKTGFSNFVELHNAWRKTLDISELNKKFYRELANWYFWALQNVEFPDDAEKNREIRNATSVIRLLTRLIFIWFIKEKGLVPDDLFNQTKLKTQLNWKDKNKSTYYKAILQNLFFATLNTEMNKDKAGSRKFRGKNKGDGRDQHYMIHNIYRYEDYFINPQETLKKYFEDIPFLNGGLFECLDKTLTVKGKDTIIRIDGFSDHPKNMLKVPDYLFFSSEQSIDLNEEYGTKDKIYIVRGLIDILDSYKFTVDENTPVEEEIALDPELLGKVFENLLASYNPETQTTARKQTGSFYTPREIVNYMVDESLIAYLSSQLSSATGEVGKYEHNDVRLRHLLSYSEEPHQFSPKEIDKLVDAIDTVKILDPACGSGAFPMGILHKLVFLLGNLDPNNQKLKQKQINKVLEISDVTERGKLLEDIEQSFRDNELDYGRKLYLIENCIFGIDVQPIAVQIAKLRFFISLIVDQKINSNKDNLSVRPLPNLETKFVAANSLIGIEKSAQMILRNPEIDQKERELKKVRERHFTARTPKTKEKYRKEDECLRTEISELLKKDGFPRETTEKLAKWNPYDQSTYADFFDPEWMFGVTDGFDVIIGNPPYLESRHSSFSEALKEAYQSAVKKRWDSLSAHITKGADLLIYFYESAISFINNSGIITFITQNSWLNSDYGKKFQLFLLKTTNVQAIIDSDFKYFDSKDGPNINAVISIFIGKKVDLEGKLIFARYHDNFQGIPFSFKEAGKLAQYNFAKVKEYKYSDEQLTETKWGILLSAEDFILGLISLIKKKALYLEKLSDLNLKIGQGLNLSKEYIVSSNFIHEHFLKHAAIPFVTSDDGAPFVLNSTANYILDKNKISKEENKILSSKKVKVFDLETTDKITPILFLPRGIGRHFCSINKASAFTASFVDIYDYNKSVSEDVKLNLWLFLNSSITWLLREISGRKNLGGGMLKAEATDLKSFPIYMRFNKQTEIIKILETLSKKQAKDCIGELYSAEHKLIDKLVFDHIGVSQDLQNRTIAYLDKLINDRHSKSKS